MKRHVILVGLPGAGKTTAGRIAARQLGAPFTDLDEVIATRAGKSIARIFAEDGEPAFRRWEADIGRETFAAPAGVIALGGGFVADAGKRASALAAGLVIYLQTSPGVAASRLGAQTGRPLLDGGNLPERLGELLGNREDGYLEAQHIVTTDTASLDSVATEISKLARQRGGW